MPTISFVPDGTRSPTARKPSVETLGYCLSPCGLWNSGRCFAGGLFEQALERRALHVHVHRGEQFQDFDLRGFR